MANRRLIVGNWKMNGRWRDLPAVETVAAAVGDAVDVALCPPATLIAAAVERAEGTALRIGAQDCHAEPDGAHTGDLSAEMLADAGARLVIVGHSERRQAHGETDEAIGAKLGAAWRAGLVAILCIGETEDERDAGRALSAVGAQLSAALSARAEPERLVVAYEPVWAIGSGRRAEAAEIEEMHAHIRARLDDRLGAAAAPVRVLYGGSVKPDTAGELFAVPGVDGALVGGASLDPQAFLAIAEAG